MNNKAHLYTSCEGCGSLFPQYQPSSADKPLPLRHTIEALGPAQPWQQPTAAAAAAVGLLNGHCCCVPGG
jgi:hypothetical protein